MSKPKDKASPKADNQPEPNPPAEKSEKMEKEVGGRDGPEPTRYGDWEVNGICVDF